MVDVGECRRRVDLHRAARANDAIGALADLARVLGRSSGSSRTKRADASLSVQLADQVEWSSG
jgi:hypothetical protein